jgi:hypothetical protein
MWSDLRLSLLQTPLTRFAVVVARARKPGNSKTEVVLKAVSPSKRFVQSKQESFLWGVSETNCTVGPPSLRVILLLKINWIDFSKLIE